MFQGNADINTTQPNPLTEEHIKYGMYLTAALLGIHAFITYLDKKKKRRQQTP